MNISRGVNFYNGLFAAVDTLYGMSKVAANPNHPHRTLPLEGNRKLIGDYAKKNKNALLYSVNAYLNSKNVPLHDAPFREIMQLEQLSGHDLEGRALMHRRVAGAFLEEYGKNQGVPQNSYNLGGSILHNTAALGFDILHNAKERVSEIDGFGV